MASILYPWKTTSIIKDAASVIQPPKKGGKGQGSGGGSVGKGGQGKGLGKGRGGGAAGGGTPVVVEASTFVNGDFETGDNTGWESYNATSLSATLPLVSSGTLSGSGSYIGRAGVDKAIWGQEITFTQKDINKIEGGKALFNLKYYASFAGAGDPTSLPYLNFFDTNGDTIGGHAFWYTDYDWNRSATQQISFHAPIPAGAGSFRFGIHSESNAIQYDEFEYEIIEDDALNVINLFSDRTGENMSDFTMTAGTTFFNLPEGDHFGSWNFNGVAGGSGSRHTGYVQGSSFGTDLATAVADGRAFASLSAYAYNDNNDDRARIAVREYTSGASLIGSVAENSGSPVNVFTSGRFYNFPGTLLSTTADYLDVLVDFQRIDGAWNDAGYMNLHSNIMWLDGIDLGGTPTSDQWRIRTWATDDGSEYVEFAEIEFRDTVSGSNICTGGTASMSSVFENSSTYNADKALDSTGTTFTRTAQGDWPATWEYTFASDVNVAEVAISSTASVTLGRLPRLISVEYFNGSGWVVQKVFPVSAWSATETKTFAL